MWRTPRPRRGCGRSVSSRRSPPASTGRPWTEPTTDVDDRRDPDAPSGGPAQRRRARRGGRALSLRGLSRTRDHLPVVGERGCGDAPDTQFGLGGRFDHADRGSDPDPDRCDTGGVLEGATTVLEVAPSAGIHAGARGPRRGPALLSVTE